MATVWINDDFLTAFSRIPRSKQKKVRTFLSKFRANPKAPSINYEKINNVKDDQVRTVRIDGDYRGVVLHPTDGDTYALVWVDNHDEAMAWARRKVFSVHPATGGLQMIDVEEAQASLLPKDPIDTPSQEMPDDEANRLFSRFSDDDLEGLGLPTPLLPSVRSLTDESTLDRLHPHLPAEASEALYGLAAGLTLEEVRKVAEESAAAQKQAQVDQPDALAVALEHPDSKRRFHVVQNERDLTEILNAPLEQWRVFLHPTQRALVERHYKGPAQVMGGAGTGKTVVLMHRARHLARTLDLPPGSKILVTSFNRNLSEATERNLRTLCTDEELERLDVRNIDSVAARIVRAHGESFNVADDKDLDACWETAVALSGELDLPVRFYREEWERVIQTQGIMERLGYLKASRRGRGTRLSRPQRAQVWEVFEGFKAEMRARGLIEWPDVARRARSFVEEEGHEGAISYAAALIDEAQDLHQEQWRLLRALVPRSPNDLFLAGDAHQRIYARRVVLSRLGIEVRGRSRTLRINYRTTERIRRLAVAVLAGQNVDDLDGGQADEKGYRSLRDGLEPIVREFASEREESEFLVRTIGEIVASAAAEGDDPYQSICLVARTRAQARNSYAAALEAAGIPVVMLEQADPGPEVPGVRVATMHRVKGLEFGTMILAGARDGIVPLAAEVERSDDPDVQDEARLRERSLFYTAALRARERLYVTAPGPLTHFLRA